MADTQMGRELRAILNQEKTPAEHSDSIEELLKLMNENGRQGQAQDLSLILWHLEGMERQYNAVVRELQSVRSQLEHMTTRQSPAKNALQKALAAAENKLDAVREQLQAFRESIGAWAKDAVENFKTAGVSALDHAVSALRFKPALENLQRGLQKSVSGINAAIERGEKVGAELHTANRHIKLALYAAIGKKPPSHLGGSDRFQAAVMAPLRGIRRLLSNMNNNTLGAIHAMERLEQAAEQGRESRAEKKPSLRKQLNDLKAETAARSSDTPEKEHKPQEVEL